VSEIPSRAKLLIGGIVLAAAAVTLYAVLGMHPWHHYQSLVLLVIAVLASRLKLKLPGLNGNMSVNLPFVLIAVIQLSLPEALLIALASTAAQCFPRGGGKPTVVQMVFNVSTMAVAVGLSSGILWQTSVSRLPWASTSLLLSLAAASFFLAQTLPVATIISLTEGGGLLKIWSSIFHLSFPYYVLSAGMSSLVTTATHRIGWPIPVLLLPVMYGVYCSFRLYFGRAVEAPQNLALAKSASGQ
jgi:hypothetical protein